MDHLSPLYLRIPPLTATFSELVLSSLVDQAMSEMKQWVAGSLLRDSNTQIVFTSRFTWAHGSLSW